MSPELPQALRVAVLAIRALDAAGVAYHIGGSLASSFHGMPRQTNDMDLVVEMNASQVKPLGAALGASFYYDEESATSAIRGRESFNLIHLESGIKVDVFLRGDTDFDIAEFSRRRPETEKSRTDSGAISSVSYRSRGGGSTASTSPSGRRSFG